MKPFLLFSTLDANCSATGLLILFANNTSAQQKTLVSAFVSCVCNLSNN
jgi:hypothetical protein